MTKRVKERWNSLSFTTRLITILTIFSALAIGPIMAIAGSGITFSLEYPKNTTITNPKETISVKATTYEGVITNDDVTMTVNGVIYSPSVTSSQDGSFLISYTPSEKLEDKSHSVIVDVYDSSNGPTTTNWTFTVDAAPNPSNHVPGKDSSINVTNPTISLHVADLDANLNQNSLKAKLNGTHVTPTLNYKGHYEYDSCGSWWVIDSYKEGTIAFNASGLKDGINTVEISIADAQGNLLTEQWSFTVAQPPKISNISPKDKSEHVSVNGISAVITDNTAVDWSSVQMIINGQPKRPEINLTTSTATYSYAFPTGIHNITLEAKDQMGNKNSTSLSFTVGGAPTPSNWKPAKNEKVSISNPDISLYVMDSSTNLNAASVKAWINGTLVSQTNFQFKGHWEYDSCVGDFYVIDSYKEGTVSFKTTGLKDGENKIKVQIADVVGNVMTEEWSFIVAEGPKFGAILPTDKSENATVNQVSAVITDNSSVDWSSVKFTINGTIVNPATTESTKTATYNYSFPTGSHTIKVEAKDLSGNLSVKTWSFIRDGEPPQIKSFTNFSDGMTISNGKLNVDIVLQDLVNLKTNAVLYLDGNKLASAFRYEGFYDSCGDYNVESFKEGHVEYQGAVTNGDHVLTLYAEDILGNNKTYTWKFKVATKPVISSESPIKYGITDLTPTISAVVKSINGSINPASILLTLNGTKVQPTYDASVGKVTYTPASNLADETYYTVILSVADNTGLTESRTWRFQTSTYPDMSDSNITNCTLCHSVSYTGLNGDFEGIHARKLSFGGGHSNNDCSNCHSYVSVGDGCSQCHGDVDYDYAPHGSTPSIQYSATNYQTYYPLRIETNREMWDCVICHQPGAGTKNRYGTPLKNHDIPEVHKTTTENYSTCNSCHAKSLTREHTRAGRVDKSGNAITCATCHGDPNLKPTIDANKTDCSSCHTNVDHNELHTFSAFSSSCMTSGCHTSNSLSAEHQARGFSCDSCHNSSTSQAYTADFKQGIYTAITWSQLSCSECHSGSTKHGVTFAKTIPEDLKYQPTGGNLEWMKAKSLAFWQGESWVPSDMAEGLYAVTKRDPNLDGTEVFNFYTSRLTELGWTKTSGPSAGSSNFELIYSKGKAKVIIRFYDGEHLNSTSLNKGYRIEVLYISSY